MPKLMISGATYELVEQVITVGRAPDNTIHLDDPSVSGRHAELRAAGKAYQLRDLGSTNGTRVNGSPTGEIILHSGDRIRFGAVDARFEGDMPRSATQPRQKSMRRWRQPVSARPILPTPRHSGLGANNAIPVGPLYL